MRSFISNTQCIKYCMFDFFGEIKSKFSNLIESVNDYKIVNFSNKIIYVEGQRGLITISDSIINFKIHRGVITIEGKNLKVKECTSNTIIISGEVEKVGRQ